MAPRRSKDGKGPFKYNDTPRNCDGFNVTFMCSEHLTDCVCGSCWHMDRVRMMVRRWFAPLGPPPRLGWERPEPRIEPELSKAEQAEFRWLCGFGAKVAERRAAVWLDRFNRRWRGVPARLWKYRDTGGGSWIGGDVDGTGSWGRHVRLWEDREDER